MRIIPIDSNYSPIVNELIRDEWAGPMIVSKFSNSRQKLYCILKSRPNL